MARRIIVLGIAAAVLAGVIALYAWADPAEAPFPKCMFRSLTGLSCPGCGSQRAIHALLHADVAAAWRLNALFVIEIPLIALLALSWALGDRTPRLRRLLAARPLILAILAAIIIWTIVRNILHI